MASLSPSVVFTFQASQLFAVAAAHVSLSRVLLLRLLANSKLTFNLTLPPSQPSILSALPHTVWRILTDFLQARALMAYEYGRELNNIIHTVVPCIPVGRALDGCRVPVRGQSNADNNHHDSS